MAITLRVKGIEFVCDTWEEADEAVRRYGAESPASNAYASKPAAAGGNGSGHSPGAPAMDTALLRELLKAGSHGVKTKTIESMAGAKAKALRPALQKWAIRVGLAADENTFPFENARPEGARGWRLSDGALAGAKELVEGARRG